MNFFADDFVVSSPKKTVIVTCECGQEIERVSVRQGAKCHACKKRQQEAAAIRQREKIRALRKQKL